MVTFGPERETELVLKRGVSGSSVAAPSWPRRLAGVLAESLDVAHRQTFGNDAVGGCVRVGDGEERASVAGRDLPLGEQLLV